MFAGAFALVERSLRVDARSRSTHLIRLGLMGAIYFALFNALITGIQLGAPGMHFFGSIAYLEVVFLSLMGIGFFSSVISEEKEEDTLGLMLMAGISPFGILAGKSVGGLWQAVLLIVVQYPFCLLAITMGGVTHLQVWAVTVALLAYIIFLSGFGLLCSTVSPRNRTAAWWMSAGLIAYVFMPIFAMSLSAGHIERVVSGGETWNVPNFVWPLLEVIGGFSVFLQLSNILSTGFSESALSTQVISNMVMGAISVGLAWLLFGIAARSPSSEATTRGLVARRRGFLRFPAGRSWDNPFLWKDYHFVSGGVGMTFLRTLFFIVLGLIPCIASIVMGRDDFGEWISIAIMLLIFCASISAARVLARSMHDEIRGQTLASLMMLPRSTPGIVYSKYAGALLGWIPGPVIGPFMLLTSDKFRNGLADMLTRSPAPQNEMYFIMIFALGVLVCVLFFLLTPHFAALLALYMRWGAVPLAIGLTFAVYMGLAIFTMTSFFLLPGVQIDPAAGLALLAIFLFCLCGACHIGVLLRIQALAAQ